MLKQNNVISFLSFLLSLFVGSLYAMDSKGSPTPRIDHSNDTPLQRLMYKIDDIDLDGVKAALSCLSAEEKSGLMSRQVTTKRVVGAGDGAEILDLTVSPARLIEMTKMLPQFNYNDNDNIVEIEKQLQDAEIKPSQ